VGRVNRRTTVQARPGITCETLYQKQQKQKLQEVWLKRYSICLESSNYSAAKKNSPRKTKQKHAKFTVVDIAKCTLL
jgi:hypothetical protein